MINDFCSVIFNKDSGMGRAYISFRDLTDRNNDPSGYTKNVRGIDRVWRELERVFTPKMRFNEVGEFLDERGLNTHTYCAVD